MQKSILMAVGLDYQDQSHVLKEGDEVVSGGYRAIGRDLEDGKKIKKGVAELAKDEKQDKPN